MLTVKFYVVYPSTFEQTADKVPHENSERL
jgi:hypothetical protein